MILPKTKKIHKNSYGFTLIELIIVIVLLGVLMAVTIYTFSTAPKKARDAKRQSEIEQYRAALESYANLHSGLYPSRTSAVVANSTLCADLGLGSSCAADPLAPTHQYYYISNGTGGGTASGTAYAIYAYLERPTTNNYFVLCSNGNSFTSASAPLASDCD